jgi:hypothetical protein
MDNDDLPTVASKQKERLKLEARVAEFKAKGGVVIEVPPISFEDIKRNFKTSQSWGGLMDRNSQ